MTDFFLKRLVLSVLLAVCLFSLGADDRTEVSKLKMENRRLHAELDRLRKQLTAKDNDLLKFRHFLAATAEAGKVMTASERERQLTDSLKEIVARSNRLLVHISGVETIFRDLLKELPVGPARQARLLLQLEQMERYALQLSTIAGVFEERDSRQVLENVRVVAVNRELDTVILSSGSVHGVFPGLMFQSKRDGLLRLRVISVRPWVCAAVPIGVSAEPFTPGMEFTIAHRAAPGEGIRPLH